MQEKQEGHGEGEEVTRLLLAVALSLIFSLACGTYKHTAPGMYMHREVELDKDQVLVCFYDLAENAVYCRDPSRLERELEKTEESIIQRVEK